METPRTMSNLLKDLSQRVQRLERRFTYKGGSGEGSGGGAASTVSRVPLAMNGIWGPWNPDTWGPNQIHGAIDVSVPFWVLKNSSGIVTIVGTGASSSSPSGGLIGTLPEGYRPSALKVFTAFSSDGNLFIHVHPDGRIMLGPFQSLMAGSSISFGSVVFFEASKQPAINSVTLLNDFVTEAGFEAPGYSVDEFGDIWLSGYTKRLTAWAADLSIFALPGAYDSPTDKHFACASSAGYAGTVGSNVVAKKAAAFASFLSLEGIVFSPSDSGYTSLVSPAYHSPYGYRALQNSWERYPSFSLPSLKKRPDGLVLEQGLVRNGTSGIAKILDLPPTLRPMSRVNRPAVSNDATTASVSIGTAGEVTPAGNTTWFSLDGLAHQAYA